MDGVSLIVGVFIGWVITIFSVLINTKLEARSQEKQKASLIQNEEERPQ